MQKLATAVVLALAAAAGLGLTANTAVAASTAPSGHTVASPPRAAAQPQPPLSGPSAVPGAQLWVNTYNGTGNGSDVASSVAVSPGGGRVFVTGNSVGTSTGSTVNLDYATVGYDAATGARLWARRYNGPGNGNDIAFSVAVSRAVTRCT